MKGRHRMGVRVEIPEGRREMFRAAMIKMLPCLTCDVCGSELDAHTWFEVRSQGTRDARIVRCSGVEPDGFGHQEETG